MTDIHRDTSPILEGYGSVSIFVLWHFSDRASRQPQSLIMAPELRMEEGRGSFKIVLDGCQKKKKGRFVNGHLEARSKHIAILDTPSLCQNR